MEREPGGAREVQFTPEAAANLAAFPEIAEDAERKARSLGGPGAADQLGKPLRGELQGLRRLSLGSHHRLIYDPLLDGKVVVIAIGKRRDDEVYRVAAEVLRRRRPPSGPITIRGSTGSRRPSDNDVAAKPERRAKTPKKKRGRRRRS